MAYNIFELEKASGRMVEAAVSREGSVEQRIDAYTSAESRLAVLRNEIVEGIQAGNEIDPQTLVSLGIFATRNALFPLVLQGSVGFTAACAVRDELQDLCTLIAENTGTRTEKKMEMKGFSAEIAIAQTFWSGIVDGELGLGHAILLGAYGRSKGKNGGLKDDVDFIIQPDWYEQKAPQMIQLKSSTIENIEDTYLPGIPVVSAQEIAGTDSSDTAVKKLLAWEKVLHPQRLRTYRRIEEKLGLTRPEAGSKIVRTEPNIIRIAA